MNPRLTVLTAIRGGVFTRADARACGYPEADIDSLLATGGWRRVRPGTYAAFRELTPVTEETLHLRRAFQVLHRRPGEVASHQTAAALYGLPLWGLDLTAVQVTTADRRPVRGGTATVARARPATSSTAGERVRSRSSPAVVKRPASSSPSSGESGGGVVRHLRPALGPGILRWSSLQLRVVSPARAVSEVAATCATAPAQAVADAALYSGLTTATALGTATKNLLDGTDRARYIVSRATAESASVAESRLRLILAEAGLPAPSSSPPPGIEAEQVGCSLWFPEQRTVVGFEPRRPYWSDDPGDSTPALTAYLAETADQVFGTPRPGRPADPAPAGSCWIAWADLDDPPRVADRVRSTFAEAYRRTGVTALDPTRRRSRRPYLPATRTSDAVPG